MNNMHLLNCIAINKITTIATTIGSGSEKHAILRMLSILIFQLMTIITN